MGNSKTKVLHALKKSTPAVSIAKWGSKFARSFSSWMHGIQFTVEWGVDNPEFFDHEIDLHHQWAKTRAAYPMERGAWSSFALTGDGDTLDLCCGDGFYSKMFYSLRSNTVVSIDFDPEAIRWANRNHSAPNVTYVLGDIRTDIPAGPFDNIVWDAAVEHFTEDEIAALMGRIKAVLKTTGVISGYTIVESAHDHKHLHQHEYEFHDKEDLARFFSPHFKNVQVFETVYPDRTNLYFYASDHELPFETGRNLLIAS